MSRLVAASNDIHICCDPATAFEHIYQTDLMAKWFGGFGLKVKLLNFKRQRVGQKQSIRLVPIFFCFETEVTEVSQNRYIRGRISGMMAGTWAWSVIPEKDGVSVKHEFYAKGTNRFFHLLLCTVVKWGDHLYYRLTLPRLKRILERNTTD